MRSPTRSRAAISTISATSSAISCCRWSITPAWRRSRSAFAFGDVVEAITRKMIRRHPHVFADKDGNIDAGRRQERLGAHQGRGEGRTRRAAAAASKHEHTSLLSSVKAGQPALTRAMELQRKASTVGFDWNDPRAVLNKIREEADEIEAALDRNDADELAEETGDLLFALVNLARHVGADPEMALRRTNAKFERRFAYIERALAAQGALAGEAHARRDGRAVERGEGERNWTSVQR